MKSKIPTIFRWGAAALMVGTLAACGGGGGGGTTAAAPPPGTTPPAAGVPPAATPPTGAAPITLTAATPVATYAALDPVVAVGGAVVNSPPCVSFSMADASNNPIIGFGSTMQRTQDVNASYPNLAFSLAKLMPASNGSPSKWVSYIVVGNPSFDTDGTTVLPGNPGRPSTDNTGTLTDNKDGTYVYCFRRDVTTIADEVAGATLTAPNVAADLGDLSYDPTLPHRLTIQIAGDVPGTGTNTADGVQVTDRVRLSNPVNVVYDFIPATGQAIDPADAAITQRLIVDKASCNECHAKLGGIPGTDSQTFHSGSRYDPKYCVVCHTDQRKYGRTPSTSVAGVFTGSTYVADGVTVGDFPVLIHRVHKGEGLIKKGYDYGGVLLNETKYPQDYRNCTKCHDDTAPKVAPQASNWKMVPSRLACGACHDGIDWATGKGTTNAGGTGGHIGGAKQDDSQCVLCHDDTTIPVYHIPVTRPSADNAFTATGTNTRTNSAWIASNTANLPAGAIKVDYDIKSVVRNTSQNVEITFRLLQNGVAVDLNDSTAKTEIWDNFMGAPTLYCAWGQSDNKDGITAPADFTNTGSSWLRSIWNGTATGTKAGTLSAKDATGYYKATLTGFTVPDGATMLSCGLGYDYQITTALPLTQTNLEDYPVSASAGSAGPAGIATPNGGLIAVVPDAQKVASAGSAAGGTGGAYTARRPIVSDALCNACHQELGIFAEATFHGGQRNDGSTCSWCHNPGRASSGWTADSTNFVHAIHAASKRTEPYTWHSVSATENFSKVEYPGILSKCDTCHLAGTYDFSASASTSQLPNRLYRTVATSAVSANDSTSPYVTVGVDNSADNLVISPIAAACVSCHDAPLAISHMESNGGSFYRARSTAITKLEECTLCHLAGKVADIKAVHNK